MYVYHYCLLLEGNHYFSSVFESAIMVENHHTYNTFIGLIADSCGCSGKKFVIVSLSLVGKPNVD
jgi:hypothetical protein